MTDLLFNSSKIRNVNSYNPEASVSGSFTFNKIRNAFNLVISYDENNKNYTPSFVRINTSNIPMTQSYLSLNELTSNIFNKTNLEKPVTDALNTQLKTKKPIASTITDLLFNSSKIRNVNSYNPEASVSGSFTFNKIINAFNLVISYDENNKNYTPSFVRINTSNIPMTQSYLSLNGLTSNIFNKTNLEKPTNDALVKTLISKSDPTPTITFTDYKISDIKGVNSYNPEARVSGSFKYRSDSYFFNLIISYDEQKITYTSFFVNVNKGDNDLAPSKWNQAVQKKLNTGLWNPVPPKDMVTNVKLDIMTGSQKSTNSFGNITIAEYKGTGTWHGAQRVISAQVWYNGTKQSHVMTALKPFVSNVGTDLFGQIFGSVPNYIRNKYGYKWNAKVDIDKNGFDVTISNSASLTATKLIVSGYAKLGNPVMSTKFIVNLSYNYNTLKYSMDPSKDIRVIPNNRMLLMHDKIENIIKAKLNTNKDTLKNFAIASFVSKDHNGPLVNVVGELATPTLTIKVFTMQVRLENQLPIAGTYKVIDTDGRFKDFSTNGDLYKTILPTIKTVKDFDHFAITKIGKITFSDKDNNYQTTATISLDVTLKNKKVVHYTESVTYEFVLNKFNTSDLVIVK